MNIDETPTPERPVLILAPPTIRRMSADDMDALLPLFKKYAEGLAAACPECASAPTLISTFRREWYRLPRTSAVATVGDRIIGFCLWSHEYGTDTATALGTYVEPEYRRMGVAKNLRTLCTAAAVAYGIKHVIGVAFLNNLEGVAAAKHLRVVGHIVVHDIPHPITAVTK